MHASRKAIGALLLAQSLFAGIGNVYRAELLFLTGLHPETRGMDIPKDRFEHLWKLAKELLRRGVAANLRSFGPRPMVMLKVMFKVER